MPLRLGFIGFRHGHILSLYDLASQSAEVQIVGACEEHGPTRQNLAERVKFTHDSAEALLDGADCEAIAIGDYYARRGPLAIAALQRGLHIIADKPLCTDLDEVERMEALAQQKDLRIGCMLNMRDGATVLEARRLVQSGAIGQVHAITFGGQHPLLLGSRPDWYFEKGKHGGTLNDIGIHAFDALPWITGLGFSRVEAARCWNAFAPQYPHFDDGAQALLTMENGCGVTGDVSYFAPDGAGYALPQYWRTTFWGRDGLLEFSSTTKTLTLVEAAAKEPRQVPPGDGNPGGYLKSFLRDIAGTTDGDELDTAAVLRAARTALTVQRAADLGQTSVAL